jgi:hypothetical protein
MGKLSTFRSGCILALISGLPSPTVAQAPRPPQPLPVAGYFAPSGWMGDGEKGTKYVRVNPMCTDNPRRRPYCEQWVYAPDDAAIGWAAVAYQYPENNSGDRPGLNLSRHGYTRLTFWARGLKGDERVLFKAGDHTKPDVSYPASFVADTGYVTLTRAWKQYSVDLRGKDLSNVVCGFAWVARQAPDGGPIVFYVDDVRYE